MSVTSSVALTVSATATVIQRLERWCTEYQERARLTFWGGTSVGTAQIQDIRRSGPLFTELNDWCSIFVDVFFANSERPATKKFVDDFGSAYHRAPGFLESHAFDAAGILKRVIEQRRPQTREDLRSALVNLGKPFEGAAGDTVLTAFDRKRPCRTDQEPTGAATPPHVRTAVSQQPQVRRAARPRLPTDRHPASRLDSGQPATSGTSRSASQVAH